uniref:Crinkler effector protein N-terminal domain-containing protein n=2 Tax=Rhizophagus irregularis TaxID=588596 RepID=U9TGZ0_RHIID
MTYYVVLGEVPVKRKLDFVEFESSELVMNLRHVIYDKKKNTFFKQNIDESDLVLWKVDISFGNENDNLKMLDDTSCIINVKQDLEGKEMFSGDPISDHLEHFDKTRCSIHIIVLPPPPPPRERKMVEDEEDNRVKKEKFQNLLNSLPEINIQDKIQNSADTSLLAIQQYETVTALIYPSGDKECVIGKVQYRQIAEEQDVWCIIDGKRDQLGHDFSNGKLIMVHQRNQLLVIFQSSVPSESLKDKFKLCGGISRLIFGESGMLCNQAKDFSGDEFTHKLIHMHINLEETEVEGEKADPYTCCSCFFGSDYIAYKCLKRLKEDKEDLRTFIETAMGSLCEQLFELVSHEILGTFSKKFLFDDISKIEKNIIDQLPRFLNP